MTVREVVRTVEGMARNRNSKRPAPATPKSIETVPAPQVEAQRPEHQPGRTDHLYRHLAAIERAPDAWTTFRQVVALRNEVDDLVAHSVGWARGEGATWERLAGVLNVQRQAVWQRYGRPGAPKFEIAQRAMKETSLSPEEFAAWQAEQHAAARAAMIEAGADPAQFDNPGQYPLPEVAPPPERGRWGKRA